MVKHRSAVAHADLVLTNARVVTMDCQDRTVEAIAIAGERVAAAGSVQDIRPLIGKQTKVIDVGGATVLPGLIDAHAHFSRIGPLAATQALLYDCTSIDEVIERLLRHRDALPDGEAILGHGDCFFETHFGEQRQIHAGDLDRVAADRPVVITDVNKTIINSYALDHCVDYAALPEGVELPTDECTGRPSGVFPTRARQAVKRPPPSPDVTPDAAVRASSAQCAACGLTTVVDAGPGPEHIRAICTLGDAGELSTRVVIMPSTRVVGDRAFREEFPGYGTAGPCYRFGPAKQFYDQFVMHRTAYMYEAYRGQPENFGATFVSLNDLRDLAARIWALGWPLGIHVTGDRALDEASRVMAEACTPISGGRSHSIHAYFPTEEALRVHRDAGLAVAVQPGFLRAWGETLKGFLGPERAARFLPLRRYLEAGVIVAGGSDAAIVHWSPFRGMAVAMDRTTLAGNCLNGDEALTAHEALSLYTTQAAKALDLADEAGSIAAGKFADLVVVDRNVLGCSAEELRGTQILLTIVSGRIIVEKTRPSTFLRRERYPRQLGQS